MTHSLSTRRPAGRQQGRAGWLALALVAAVAAGGAGYVHLQQPAQAAAPARAAPPPAMPVSVARAIERRVTEWDEFSGRLEAIERVDVRPRVSGYIEAAHFAPGALVSKGATLFTIDARPFAAEVERAEAELAAANARVALATSELARAQKLLEDNAIARREYEARQNAERDARASVQAAQASLDIARLNLGYTRITAPIAGRVSRAEVTAGNLVAAGADGPALTSIVSVSPIYASFEIDERSYLKYAGATQGMPIHMGLADETGYPHEGRLEFLDNRLDPRSGTIRARAVFDNSDGRLTPGLYARLEVGGAGEHPAVLIDDRAVGTDQSKKFVLVVGADRRVQWREVKLGPMVGGLRVVRSGLAGGETIVVVGMQRVRPGMAVAPTEVAMDARLRTAEAAPQPRPAS